MKVHGRLRQALANHSESFDRNELLSATIAPLREETKAVITALWKG